MAQQLINIGAVANDRTGDTWRTSLDKTNQNFTELYSLGIYTKRVLCNSLADFPTPLASVITLAANTQYFCANDIAFANNTVVAASNSAIQGLNRDVVTLSYTGSGDLLSVTNVTFMLSDCAISAPSGRLFNWSETTGKDLTITSIIISSLNKFGVFNGATGTIEIKNIKGVISTDGLEFTGNLKSFQSESSIITMTAGAFLNLGTGTFDTFSAQNEVMTLNGTSTFLSGAAASANINSVGLGSVFKVFTTGAGTPLTTITESDIGWSFFGNNDMLDSHPDGLLSMQANATTTTIVIAGTHVLVAGTWVVGETSQMTGTTAGRLTYNGLLNIRMPITFSLSVAPASGTNKFISAQVAFNGVAIPASNIVVEASSGSPIVITIPWQKTFTTGDYIEVFVTNNTDTIAVLVSSAISRVN